MSTIIIKLPRPTLGNEVLNAFRNASTFIESASKKWEAYKYSSEHGFASADNTFFPNIGIRTTIAYFQKQGHISRFLCGKRNGKWKTLMGMGSRFMSEIHLHPVPPNEIISEVKVNIHHEYDPDPAGGFMVANTPDDPAFAQFRPAYDRIIKGFLQRIE